LLFRLPKFQIERFLFIDEQRQKMMKKFSYLLRLAVIAIPIIGCGVKHAKYDSLGLVEVSGTVTLDDVPVSGVTVMFRSQTPGEGYSYGTTDENGHYSLQFNSEKSGVTPGEKKVWIVSAPQGEDAVPGEGQKAPTEKIPAKYHRETTLTATVVEKKSQTFHFDLKSK
jgi:hypothetical protein